MQQPHSAFATAVGVVSEDFTLGILGNGKDESLFCSQAIEEPPARYFHVARQGELCEKVVELAKQIPVSELRVFAGNVILVFRAANLVGGCLIDLLEQHLAILAKIEKKCVPHVASRFFQRSGTVKKV